MGFLERLLIIKSDSVIQLIVIRMIIIFYIIVLLFMVSYVYRFFWEFIFPFILIILICFLCIHKLLNLVLIMSLHLLNSILFLTLQTCLPIEFNFQTLDFSILFLNMAFHLQFNSFKFSNVFFQHVNLLHVLIDTLLLDINGCPEVSIVPSKIIHFLVFVSHLQLYLTEVLFCFLKFIVQSQSLIHINLQLLPQLKLQILNVFNVSLKGLVISRYLEQFLLFRPQFFFDVPQPFLSAFYLLP